MKFTISLASYRRITLRSLQLLANEITEPRAYALSDGNFLHMFPGGILAFERCSRDERRKNKRLIARRHHEYRNPLATGGFTVEYLFPDEKPIVPSDALRTLSTVPAERGCGSRE